MSEHSCRYSHWSPVVFSLLVVISFCIVPATVGANKLTESSTAGSAHLNHQAVSQLSLSESSDIFGLSGSTTTSGQPVGGCTNITSPGAYYLTGNITAPADDPCIFINSSDVSLSGNGYTIYGNGSGSNDGHPIAVQDSPEFPSFTRGYLSNVTVRNVRVANWSQTVLFYEVDDATVEHVDIRDTFHISGTSSGTGLRFYQGTNVTATHSTIVDTAARGITAQGTENAYIAQTTIRNTGQQGIFIGHNAGHIIRNNTIVEGDSHGVRIENYIDSILIEKNTIRSNKKTGIRSTETSNITIRNNTITSNTRRGIRVSNGDMNATIAGNTLRGNGYEGIWLEDLEGNLVANNEITNNGIAGIDISRADNSSVRNNTVKNNSEVGILSIEAIGVAIEGNLVTNHTGDSGKGIRFRRDFDDAAVAENTICGNKLGISIYRGSGPAVFENNRIVGNTVDGIRLGYFTPVDSVDIRHNVITNNPDYGINVREDDNGNADARDNWWGDQTGPSSPDDISGSLEDPVTGTLADGAGDAVSENESDPGVSNVRFDPWLSSEPSTGRTCPSEGTNDPPSVSAEDGNVSTSEGNTATNNGTVSDPDGDTVSVNASVGNVTTTPDGSWNWTFTTIDGPDQSQTVNVTATDEDGATNKTSFELTVTNEPPLVSADNASVTVDTGETATNTGTYGDPGNDTVNLTASVGTVNKTGTGTWNWSYPTTSTDDSQIVTITATDDDGATNETTFNLTVENPPPSVTVANETVDVEENQTATNDGTYADPDGENVTLTASVGTVTNNNDGTWEWSFTTTDGPEESQTVTITAEDEAGNENETSFELTVENVPPTVDADNSTVTVVEGETATNTGTFADPGADTVNLTASVGSVTKQPNGTWEWSYQTSDGPDESQGVTITATDDDGDSNQTTFDLTVENLPPTVKADNDSVTVAEGDTATNTGTYGDPGNDTVDLSASVGTVTKYPDGTWDWSYDTTGSSDQTVTITATDADGASAETTFELIVEETLEPGEDYTADFKGCSEVWIVFETTDQLPVDASIWVYNAQIAAEENVSVSIDSASTEQIAGQYGDRPVYKFNVHDYFGRSEDSEDKILGVSVGGGSVAENTNQCADQSGDEEDSTGRPTEEGDDEQSGNGSGKKGTGKR